MHKITATFLLLLCFCLSKAQNVGINTDGSAPAAGNMLEIKKAGKSKVAIRSTSFNDTTELQLSNRNAGNEGTDFNLRFIREQGLFISNSSDLATFNNDSLFSITPTGGVGIGTRSPQARLDVVGSIRMRDGTQGSGKILTSNASGVASWQNPFDPVAFSATGTFTAAANFQTIPPGVATQVTIVNNEQIDEQNMFNPAFTRATIPSPGLYHIDAGITYSGVETGHYVFSIKDISTTGGFNLLRTVYHTVGSGLSSQDFTMTISCDAYFEAGRTVELTTNQSSGMNQIIRGGQTSWFNMHKIK